MKKTLSVVIAAALALSMAACSSSAPAPAPAATTAAAAESSAAAETTAAAAESAAPAADGKVYKLRLGDVTVEGNPLYDTLALLCDALNERSGGRFEATLYGGSQLGSLADMTGMLMNGTLEMSTQSAGGLGSFMPEFGVLEMPFEYESHQDVYKIVDGEIGKELSDKFLEQNGVRILSFYNNLFRQTTNNVRPITKPDDYKGLNLRVPETKSVMGCMQALGANATPMAVGELYTALSQGVMDGQENPLSVIYANKYYEVQKYLSLSGHIYSPITIMCSEEWYQSLPEDLQKLLVDTVNEFQSVAREASEKSDSDFLELLEKEGMEINEVDKTGFREAVQKVYDDMIAETPSTKDYFDRINAELGR